MAKTLVFPALAFSIALVSGCGEAPPAADALDGGADTLRFLPGAIFDNLVTRDFFLPVPKGTAVYYDADKQRGQFSTPTPAYVTGGNSVGDFALEDEERTFSVEFRLAVSENQFGVPYIFRPAFDPHSAGLTVVSWEIDFIDKLPAPKRRMRVSFTKDYRTDEGGLRWAQEVVAGFQWFNARDLLR